MVKPQCALVLAEQMWETVHMAARDELQKRIDRKRGEIAEAEGRIRDARIYIQAMEDALRLLPRDESSGEELAVSPANLRPGSKVDKARNAIREANRPLHIGELVTALGIKSTQEKRAALAGSLSSYARRGEIFTRPAPNTFGLIENQARNGHGPPANFGIDEAPETESESQAENIVDQGITDDDVPF